MNKRFFELLFEYSVRELSAPVALIKNRNNRVYRTEKEYDNNYIEKIGNILVRANDLVEHWRNSKVSDILNKLVAGRQLNQHIR